MCGVLGFGGFGVDGLGFSDFGSVGFYESLARLLFRELSSDV